MTLVELLAIIRKNIKLVIALPLLFALATAAYSTFVMPVRYTATTTVYALAKSAGNTAQGYTGDTEGITSGDLQMSQMLANDFASLAESKQIRNEVASNLGLRNLNSYSINVTSATNSRLLTISVTGTDSEVAPSIANEFAKVLGETAVDVMGVEAVSVVNEASSPAPRTGPPRRRYTLIAFVAGLFIAIAAGVIGDMLNVTVRDEDELQELTDLSVVGRFPYAKGNK